jgi:hypothetical protein
MTVISARKWILIASLSVSGAVFVFVILAPILSYPLTWAQALRIVELIIPVFFGYLGSGTHYLFSTDEDPVAQVKTQKLLSILVKGPILLFAVIVGSVFIAFGAGNRSAAQVGDGMSVDTLAAWITAGLGLLTVTTNVVVSHLFSIERKATSDR